MQPLQQTLDNMSFMFLLMHVYFITINQNFAHSWKNLIYLGTKIFVNINIPYAYLQYA